MPGSGASGVSMGRLRQDGRSALFVGLWVCWLLCGLTMGGAMRLASKHKDHTALAKQRDDSRIAPRPYMQCLHADETALPPHAGFLVLDENVQATLDVECLVAMVPEQATRDIDDRLPLLDHYTCQQDAHSGRVTCSGAVGELMLEAAFSRASPHSAFSQAQYSMQEDIADLCMFWELERDQQECLKAYKGWRYWSQTLEVDHHDRHDWRVSALGWAYLENPDFVSGKMFRELDEAKKQHASMDEGMYGQYYDDLGRDPTYGDYLEEGIRDYGGSAHLLETPGEMLDAVGEEYYDPLTFNISDVVR